jgi:putative redox protein
MALKEIIVETQASLQADAGNAKTVFSVDSRQVENLRSEARIRQFSVTVDEPPSLGGSDAGPNPVELVLAALATCQEITYRAYATALGVPLESVSVQARRGSRSARFFRRRRTSASRFQRGAGNRDAQEFGEPGGIGEAQSSG